MIILIAFTLIALWGGLQQTVQTRREPTEEELRGDIVRWFQQVSPNKGRSERGNDLSQKARK